MYRSSTVGRSAGWILLLMGGFELVLAAGFWLILGGLPDAGEAMRFTAIVLAVPAVVLLAIGLLLLRRSGKVDRISATGVAGTGQIMGLRQTGVEVNDQPQVELDLLVTIPGRSPYRAKVKEIVPLIMLNRLQGTLRVKVDPAEPETVVIQWDQPNVGLGPPAYDSSGYPTDASGFTAGGAMSDGPGSSRDETLGEVAAAMSAAGGSVAPVFGDAGQAGYTIEQLRAYLRANGISGTARIDRLDDSGRTVGDERLFTMTTTISIPGRPAFVTGPSAAMVPLEKVGRVAVGVALPVKVAPDSQDMVMFEWDRI